MYLENFDLDGKTAVVTGGGQGIGFACAQALGEAGAQVVVAEILPHGSRTRCTGCAAMASTSMARRSM